MLHTYSKNRPCGSPPFLSSFFFFSTHTHTHTHAHTPCRRRRLLPTCWRAVVAQRARAAALRPLQPRAAAALAQRRLGRALRAQQPHQLPLPLPLARCSGTEVNVQRRAAAAAAAYAERLSRHCGRRTKEESVVAEAEGGRAMRVRGGDGAETGRRSGTEGVNTESERRTIERKRERERETHTHTNEERSTEDVEVPTFPLMTSAVMIRIAATTRCGAPAARRRRCGSALPKCSGLTRELCRGMRKGVGRNRSLRRPFALLAPFSLSLSLFLSLCISRVMLHACFECCAAASAVLVIRMSGPSAVA